MSNYIGKAANPRNGYLQTVEFLDDYFGEEKYGVRFCDGFVYPYIYVVARSAYDRNLYFYRGYSAEIVWELDEEKYKDCLGHYVGTVENIPDCICFAGCTIENALLEFKTGIDEYIRWKEKYK